MQEVPLPDLLQLPAGPLRDLTIAVRALYRDAGYPSLAMVANAINARNDRPRDIDQDFVRRVLAGNGVAPWPKMEALLRQLAEWTGGPDIEEIVERIHPTWLAADLPELIGRTQGDHQVFETTRDKLQVPVLGRALLQVTRGPRPGDWWLLEEELTELGRGDGCGVRLAGVAVSRRHAVIKREGAIFKIQDLYSTNGTFVNKVKLAPGVDEYLEHEDQIAVGEYRLVFLTHQTLRP